MAPAREILFAALAAAGLLGLGASFIGVKLNDPPPQHKSPVTGYPTWHQDYTNENKEITMSFTMLALLFTLTASYVAYRATRKPSRSLTGFVTLPSGNEETSTQINEFIQLYINATLVAVIGYLFFDVGKIWAVIGALHNLLEVALLIVLQSGGRVTSMSFGLYMFTYVCATILLSVYLPWPLDAIFFRWQGLCSDFGLIVMFVRMHKATKAQLDSFGDPDKHDLQLAKAQKAADRLAQQQEQSGFLASSGSLHTVHLTPANGETSTSATSLPTANPSSNPLHNIHASWKRFVARAPSPSGSDNSDHETLLHHTRNQNTNATLTPESAHTPRFGGESAQTVIQVLPADGSHRVSVIALNNNESIWGVQWKNPDQIWLLVAASVFHVIGNCVTTIFITNLYAMAAFHVSYGIAYPLYAYYLYVDNHALRQTKIYMPKFSKIKNFTYLCVALIGAIATVRAGLYVSTLNAGKD
ncbi:hypothetical protein BG015_009578 [Linnemannia schmuckeri]|uniref:Uncharacterized protein n=1 Tax=Linnemannia schmuckeri TaxID=64567 RepID=A0A9P5RYT1_9FUNG|nr:hypothetical protein BG015_009578 [Linnemannia schmuckeri]